MRRQFYDDQRDPGALTLVPQCLVNTVHNRFQFNLHGWWHTSWHWRGGAAHSLTEELLGMLRVALGPLKSRRESHGYAIRRRGRDVTAKEMKENATYIVARWLLRG